MPVWKKPATGAAFALWLALTTVAEAGAGNTASFCDQNFSLQFPSSWEREQEPGAPQILRAKAPGGEANLIVIADKSAGNVSSEEFAAVNLQALRHVFGQNLKLETDEAVALKNGHGHLLVIGQELPGQDNNPLKIKQYMMLFVAHGTGYAVTCTAPEDSYKSMEKTFQSIGQSVLITAGDTAPADRHANSILDSKTKSEPEK